MMYINVLDLVRKYTTCNSKKKQKKHNFAIMNNDLIISEYYDI